MGGWLWTRKAISGVPLWMIFGVVIAVGLGLGIMFAVRSLATPGEATTLRVALPTFGAEVLDPSKDYQAGYRYYGHMFDPLLGADQDGRLTTEVGALEGWSVGADSASYTLKLREGMRWHDGAEITSDDIRFSLRHYTRSAPACPACSPLDEAIRDVQAIDPYQVVVELRQPDIAFIARLGPVQEDVPMLPSLYWQKVGETGFAESPIGSGPWRFARRAVGEFVEYDANLDYWDPGRVRGFSRLRLVEVPDRQNRLAMLKTGAVDMAPVGPGDVARLKAEGFSVQGPKFVIETTLRFLMSHDSAFLTANPKFRQALILGMNLPAIVERVYPPEAATLASGSALFSPLTEGYDPSLPTYPYDPEYARRLLQESGYQGETVQLFSLAAYGLTEMPRLNQEIAQDWRLIGVNAKIVPTDWPPLQARLLARPQQFDNALPAPVFQGAQVNRPGGIVNSIYRHMTGSDPSLLSYHDPEKGDRIYADLIAMAEGEAREQRLRELNRELYEEYWAAPIVWRHEVWGLRSNLSGWQPTNGTASDLNFETVRPRD